MSDKIFEAPSGVARRFKEMPDGTFAEVIVAVSESGGSVADREVVSRAFRVKAAFDGGAVGDLLTQDEIFDLSGENAVIVQSLWRNQSSGTALSAPPAAADLEDIGKPGLTNAELRAAPVAVALPSASVTPAFIRTSAAGQIAANALQVTIFNGGTAAGTVLETTLDPGQSVGFTAPLGRSLTAIGYDASGTTFLIAEVR